jgi:uncharacterized membrane protein YphA (DoxX/SURF4 family)
MQRLFSTFPTGRPGVGLLLLRTVLACMVLMHITQIAAITGPWLAAIACIGAAGLLALGLFTPFAGAIGALLGGVCLVSGQHQIASDLTLIVLMLALTLIGAGAYSIDAKLFGRREVVLARKPASRTD